MGEEEALDLNAGLSNDELAERLFGTVAQKEEKQNVHAFLHNVATSPDTTKTGNVTSEELGLPKLPIRTYKELALFCKEIANMEYFAEYFNKKSEIITSTSLSKDAKLLGLAVVTRSEVANVTKPPRKENKGWFKSRKKLPQEL